MYSQKYSDPDSAHYDSDSSIRRREPLLSPHWFAPDQPSGAHNKRYGYWTVNYVLTMLQPSYRLPTQFLSITCGIYGMIWSKYRPCRAELRTVSVNVVSFNADNLHLWWLEWYHNLGTSLSQDISCRIRAGNFKLVFIHQRHSKNSCSWESIPPSLFQNKKKGEGEGEKKEGAGG